MHDPKQVLPTKPDKTPADFQLSTTTTSPSEAKSDESQSADDQFHMADDGNQNNNTSIHGKLLARFRIYRFIREASACEKSWFIVPILTYLHLYEIFFA